VRPLDSGVALAPKDDLGLGLSELGARKLGSPASTLVPSPELELVQPLPPSGKPPPASQLRAFTWAPHSRLRRRPMSEEEPEEEARCRKGLLRPKAPRLLLGLAGLELERAG
jgi:hypothetical protein